MIFNKIKIFTYIVTFITLFYSIQTYIASIDLYKPKEIRVVGDNFVSKLEVIEIVNKSIENNNILNINIKNIQENINSNPFIEKSKVYFSLPSTVEIIIKEIRPLALFQINNDIYFLDDKNNKIKANNNSINFFSVPILTIYDDQINYRATTDFLNLIKSNNKNLFYSINDLTFKNELIIISLINGTKIKMKKDHEINNTKKLLSFINSINGHQLISDFKYVDLSIPKQIIVKENKI